MLVEVLGKYGYDYVEIDPKAVRHIKAGNKDHSGLELTDGTKYTIKVEEAQRIAAFIRKRDEEDL